MLNQQQQQSSGLQGANAQTATPQTMPYNPVAAQTTKPTGMPPVKQGFATGGPVPTPPSPQQQQQQPQFNPKLIQALAQAVMTTPAMKGVAQQASKSGGPQDTTEQMFKQYDSPQGQQYLADRARMQQQAPSQAAPPPPGQPQPQAQPQAQAPAMQPPQQPSQTQSTTQGFKKGGAVKEDAKSHINKTPLKDIITMLQAHPELGGAGAPQMAGTPAGPNLRAGGAIGGQHDPDAVTGKHGMKSEARSHGAGLLSMNQDVPSYAAGGPVDGTDEVQNNDMGSIDETQDSKAGMPPAKPKAKGLIKMAGGGGLEGGTEEDDSIVGYGPDGTPIVQNPDGTEQYGDVNQLLDRPESAGTLGTGQDPGNAISSDAANAVAQPMGNSMAKGGEEAGDNGDGSDAPPPGSLKEEVADDVPAKLSPGEFVFSADAVRYYGLHFLNGLMQHARQQLSSMNADGNIRSPGDGKNPNTGDTDLDGDGDGEFMQDAKPNTNAYAPDGSNAPSGKEGLLAKHMDDGGPVDKDEQEMFARTPKTPAPTQMATGGGVAEEDFAKGGPIYKKQQNPMGRDNMVSAHPKGGSPLLDYATGGIVSDNMHNLTPKTDETKIPGLKVPKLAATPKMPSVSNYGIKTKLPKLKKGGLLNKNEKRDINQTQSYIGS